MIDGTAVNAIADLTRKEGRVVTVGGYEFYEHDGKLQDINERPVPAPATLTVHSLTGLRDYLATNRDGLDLSELVVQVFAPDDVRLLSTLTGYTQQRFEYLRASLYDRFKAFPFFAFGRWMTTEDMTISLMALFRDTPDRKAVLEWCGNVRQGGEQTLTDSGVAQSAVVKTGVAVVDRKTVPNPVTLSPFRTFTEVDQPESPFVFRLRSQDGTITAALFEADGGSWRDEATSNVARWLEAELPKDIAVVA